MDLTRVDLNLLVAFDALLSESSVTGAAKKLSIGQPAMSSTLKRLRLLLDDPVLVRDGRRMVPTPLAAALADPVREVLTHVRAILWDRRPFTPGSDHRTFTLMSSEYAALAVVHPLMAALRFEAPNIRLNIHPMADNVSERLKSHEVDLLIAPPVAVPTDGAAAFSRERLYQDRYMVAVDSNNPDVGDSLTLEQFSAMPYVATSVANMASIADSQLDELGVSRRVEVTTGFGLAPLLLRGTLLITLVPELLGRRLASGAGIRMLEPPMPLRHVVEAMIWNSLQDEDSGHMWLRTRLKAEAAALNAESPDSDRFHR